jgi:hypothetical protein
MGSVLAQFASGGDFNSGRWDGFSHVPGFCSSLIRPSMLKTTSRLAVCAAIASEHAAVQHLLLFLLSIRIQREWRRCQGGSIFNADLIKVVIFTPINNQAECFSAPLTQLFC